MSPATVVEGILATVVLFLGLALAGLVRTVDTLRRRVVSLEASAQVIHAASGIAVGASAPAFHASTPSGAVIRSTSYAGRRFVLALADPGCAACERLVPDLLSDDAAGLPPRVVAVIGPEANGSSWTSIPSRDDAVLLIDPEARIAEAFGSTVTPQVFVVDEGGSVAARGPADDLAAVGRLVREADGLLIVPDASPQVAVDG